MFVKDLAHEDNIPRLYLLTRNYSLSLNNINTTLTKEKFCITSIHEDFFYQKDMISDVDPYQLHADPDP